MNREEILLQIKKYKNRRLKSRLAHYSAVTSIFLTLSIFGSGLSSSSLLSFIMILPLPLYFIRESIKLNRKSKAIHARLDSLVQTVRETDSKFSFRSFLTQPSMSFRLTLVMFLLVIFTTVARTRVASTSISHNQLDYQVVSQK